MSENIPNKIVTCSDKDTPWINNEVKSAIRRNSRDYRKWVLRGEILVQKIMSERYRTIPTELLQKPKKTILTTLLPN